MKLRQVLRAGIAVLSIALAACAAGPGDPAEQDRSTLIHNVVLIDGTGAPPRRAAVRLRGDRIVAVGDLRQQAGDSLVDGHGKVLAPGFIDSHSHHDRNLFENRDVPAASSQGITTIVVGQDGGSRLPLQTFIDAFAARPAAVNVASYTGHNSLRASAMSDNGRRPATQQEIERMQAMLEADMAAGSLGLSTGLGYETGVFSTTDEVVELADVAARAGGRYISHIRNENVKVFAALREAIEVGRRSDLPVQVSHIKLGAVSAWGQADRVIALLQQARQQSIDITADIYPYTYWQTTMGILFPDKNYNDPEGIRRAFVELLPPQNIRLAVYAPEPALEGMTIAQIAAQRQADPAELYVELMQSAIRHGEKHGSRGESIVGTSMSEEDIAILMAWPHTNICSDGASTGGHPRGYGSFPRVLSRYVREDGVLSLAEAVHKMSGLTARQLGIQNRGTIVTGQFADLVLFDPDTVEDHARIGDSTALSSGILKVWVNGRIIQSDGRSTGIHAGRFLTRQAAAVD